MSRPKRYERGCGNCHPELITPAAQAQIDTFTDFLRTAGPPARKGDPVQSGVLSRLEHRPDLIRFALGLDEDGHNQ